MLSKYDLVHLFGLILLLISSTPLQASTIYSTDFERGELGQPLQFKSTNYHTLIAPESPDGIDVLVNGAGGGRKISRRDFCTASMEGALSVKLNNGEFEHYTFTRSNRTCGDNQKNMCRVYRGRFLGCAVFKKTKLPMGSLGEPLEPYRTVAIGRESRLRLGQVIFIEEAKGAWVTMYDGSKVQHDGYFKVADRGAFRDPMLDIYIGLSPDRTPKAPLFTNRKITVRVVNL